MKKLFLLAVLGLTTSTAFAQTCRVEMVDNRTGRLLQAYMSHDAYEGCKEGMKACRLDIRQRNLVGRADCQRNDRTQPVPVPVPRPQPQPIPYPNPYPQPNPYPVPAPIGDAQRHIQNGETVLMNNTTQTVLGASLNGFYVVRSVYGTMTNNVSRDRLAVTSGCNIDICVGRTYYSLSSSSPVTVVGLEYDNEFVTKSVYGTLTSNIRRDRLALTEGCMDVRAGHYTQQICVGNQVITRNNAYATVVGLQIDGRVVLKSQYGTITTNVDPGNLVITR